MGIINDYPDNPIAAELPRDERKREVAISLLANFTPVDDRPLCFCHICRDISIRILMEREKC